MNPKKTLRKVIPSRAIPLLESSYRKGRLATAHLRYGLPARNARVIAVTGTNGKTTTCTIINAMLRSAGYRTALFTTAVIEMDGVRSDNHAHRTVPLVHELMAFLRMAHQKNVDFVILEVTSHALEQHKVWGIPIEVAVMTNLTQDHLDYHKTMQRYALAKARLFNGYMKPKYVVLNADDAWYDYFKTESVGKVCSYGKSTKSSVVMQSIQLRPDGTSLQLQQGALRTNLHMPLVGLFNAYNAAAAACVGTALGLSPQQIEQGIASIQTVPGRMESVRADQAFDVIVDYAHTPDALQNALQTLQQITKGKVIVVFGATGDRDKTKRPIMGRVAVESADVVVLTDDETYSEDSQTIIDAVYAGIESADGASKTTVLPDREQAIKHAFAVARKGDVVLLAGLGHQNYRAMREGNIDWDDREVARKLLRG